MKTRDALAWFKDEFRSKAGAGRPGTPFSVDMFTAIAYQESGEVWPVLVDKQLGIPKILELCVGDTLDAPTECISQKQSSNCSQRRSGQEMFRIAHQSLGGHGTIQYRLSSSQHAIRTSFATASASFSTTSSFLKMIRRFSCKRNGADFGACMAKLVAELRAGDGQPQPVLEQQDEP